MRTLTRTQKVYPQSILKSIIVKNVKIYFSLEQQLSRNQSTYRLQSVCASAVISEFRIGQISAFSTRNMEISSHVLFCRLYKLVRQTKRSRDSFTRQKKQQKTDITALIIFQAIAADHDYSEVNKLFTCCNLPVIIKIIYIELRRNGLFQNTICPKRILF
jgi:hypothetical protein